MIKDYNLIQTIIIENGAEDIANLIKSALEKEVNASVIEADYNKKTEASLERYKKAEDKHKEELEIFNASNPLNSKTSVDKQMKVIITRFRALGF
jgi:hypothetical protein